MKFIFPINTEIPAILIFFAAEQIVGILIFITGNRINFMLSWVEHKKVFVI